MANAREYKSDVFSMLMQYKEYALEVYNMLNGTDYADPEMVEIITLENGILLTVRNDAAYIIDYELLSFIMGQNQGPKWKSKSFQIPLKNQQTNLKSNLSAQSTISIRKIMYHCLKAAKS